MLGAAAPLASQAKTVIRTFVAKFKPGWKTRSAVAVRKNGLLDTGVATTLMGWSPRLLLSSGQMKSPTKNDRFPSSEVVRNRLHREACIWRR